jgi:hypothetical protein
VIPALLFLELTGGQAVTPTLFFLEIIFFAMGFYLPLYPYIYLVLNDFRVFVLTGFDGK